MLISGSIFGSVVVFGYQSPCHEHTYRPIDKRISYEIKTQKHVYWVLSDKITVINAKSALKSASSRPSFNLSHARGRHPGCHSSILEQNLYLTYSIMSFVKFSDELISFVR